MTMHSRDGRESIIVVLDYVRAAALLGMIVYHARVLQRMPESCTARQERSSRSVFMERLGSFSRNTYVFLIGVSLVLSINSVISRNQRDAPTGTQARAKTAAVSFAKRKMKRAVEVAIGALVMTAASRAFMGSHRMIRWGVLHYAASVIAVGAILGAAVIWYALSGASDDRARAGCASPVSLDSPAPRASLASALAAGLACAMRNPVFKRRLRPAYVPDTPRASLWDLASGSKLGHMDRCTIDYFNTSEWALLSAMGAAAAVVALPLAKQLRGRAMLGPQWDDTVRKLSRFGLELYVTHFVLFLAAYRACAVALRAPGGRAESGVES